MRADVPQRPAFGLASAALCLELDCNTVFDGSAGAPCPRCGSVMSHPLAAWLDRGVRASVQTGSARSVRVLVASPAA
ncbi:MAG: hypothetical protein DME01_01440 [Candidatus Rokuibacteriota bacterium]|nr:MAG: hypothetical protein DME01_01440 [Candidatus Rokubacteria bacterium]